MTWNIIGQSSLGLGPCCICAADFFIYKLLILYFSNVHTRILIDIYLKGCTKKSLLTSTTVSSCKAKCVAATFGACEAIWLSNLLKELDHAQLKSTIIYVDNKSAFQLAKNPVIHRRSKYIDIWFHFLLNQVKQKVVTLKYYNTKKQVAAIFYKVSFDRCIQKV